MKIHARTWTTAVVCVSLLAVTSTSAAAAAPEPSPSQSESYETAIRGDERDTYVVFGDDADELGFRPTEEQLQESGAVNLGDVSVEATTPPEPSPALRSNATNPVLYRWTDSEGKSVVLRRNANTKITTKHGLDYRAVKTVTKHPQYRWRDSNSTTKYNYELKAVRYECSGWGPWRQCKQTSSKWVLAVVDFRTSGGYTGGYGVVTSYCKDLSTWMCPSWVKNALNAGT